MRKLIHKILGFAVIVGCCGNVMAAQMGTVNKSTNVYLLPENQSQSLYWVYEGEKFEITGEDGNFYELNVDDQVVYIDRNAITLDSELAREHTDETVALTVSSSRGEEVVAYSKQFIGTPYVSGGTDLNSGVDCSGFVQQIYKNFGVSLQRSSRDQYACNGYSVSRDELQPGDLVFYGYGSVCHVSLYIGNDQVIHAPVPGKSVCIVPIHQRGDAPIVGYKRVL